MQTPPEHDLYADRRVSFRRKIVFGGYDFGGSGLVAKMQVRQQPDTVGTPLINLGAVTGEEAEGLGLLYSGTDTIANHIAAGRLDEPPPGYETSDLLLLSQISIVVSAATLNALPYPSERGDDLRLYYDLIWDGPAIPDDVYLRGRFIVRAGVTIL